MRSGFGLLLPIPLASLSPRKLTWGDAQHLLRSYLPQCGNFFRCVKVAGQKSGVLHLTVWQAVLPSFAFTRWNCCVGSCADVRTEESPSVNAVAFSALSQASVRAPWPLYCSAASGPSAGTPCFPENDLVRTHRQQGPLVPSWCEIPSCLWCPQLDASGPKVTLVARRKQRADRCVGRTCHKHSHDCTSGPSETGCSQHELFTQTMT